MNKKIWLITHDNYIDRRIFFFADVFKEMGYTVKLFPSFYFDLLGEEDPDYVCRPNNVRKLKEYSPQKEELRVDITSFIDIIISAQSEFRRDQNRYARSMRELNMHSPTDTKWKISFTLLEDNYLLSIEDNDVEYFYSSLSGKISISYLSRRESYQEYETAILDYLTKHQEFMGQAFSVGTINVKSMINSYGETSVYAHNPNLNFMVMFNCEKKALYLVSPIPFTPVSEQTLNGKTFNYGEFEKIVYDFSPILANIRRHLENEIPDIVYVADLPTLPIGHMLKEAYGCGLVVDCHEWWHKQAQLWEKDFHYKIELSKRYEAELYPQCNLCITVGEFLAKDMGECYGRPFEVIYSCMSEKLSIKEITRDPQFWQDKFGIPLDAKIAVFQGSMTTLRNLDNLARATKWLSEGQYLAVVGGGPYEIEFRKILNQEGSPDKVLFAGWVSQNELLKYTVNADLGVLPYSAIDEYFSYSVPNKLMEYFEAKVPMLYDQSMNEISMVVKKYNVGIGADLSNAKIFGEKIHELLNSTDWLKEMQKGYTKSEFSYEGQSENLIYIIKKYFI